MANKSYSKLTGTTSSFNKMLRRFGVVTVMNAYVYEAFSTDALRGLKAVEVLNVLQDEDGTMKKSASIGSETINLQCKLDTLKIANVTIEGPSKTITGGQYANPLIKYGKTGRLEMQDALGNADAIEAMCGGIIEHYGDTHSEESHKEGATDVLHFGSDFCGEKLIVGDSFFVDTNGSQVKVKIIFYRFLPDSIFSLTQDPEGDATVFDMNGDLLTTDILVGNADSEDEVHGVFYSILPYKNVETYTDTIKVNTNTLAVTGTTPTMDVTYFYNGIATSSAPNATEGDTVVVKVYDNGVLVRTFNIIKTAA